MAETAESTATQQSELAPKGENVLIRIRAVAPSGWSHCLLVGGPGTPLNAPPPEKNLVLVFVVCYLREYAAQMANPIQ